MTVFNRKLVRARRDRAASGLDDVDFLFQEAAERLDDRLDDIARSFPVCLDLGCHTGQMAGLLKHRSGIETLIQADLSPAMAARAGALAPACAADEEWLPFKQGAFDLITSCLSLHWVNDLPGALMQIRQALKPDGLFLAVLFGGNTLTELREAFAAAEIAMDGGISPRVSPFADVRDAGGLMLRAGFKLPVVDADDLTVSYPDPLKLMSELRAMGESNAVIERRKSPLKRATLMAAAGQYAEMFGGEDGRIPASFQLITLTGWAPGPNQQEALKPGTAQSRLADALEGHEIPAGDKAPH